MSCMSSSCGTRDREQAGAQTSHPYETVGRTTASKRRLTRWPWERICHTETPCHKGLVLGRQAGRHPFAILQQPGQSLYHVARLMIDNAQELEGCRPRRTCCPTCHVSELLPLKTTTSVFEGLMVRPKPKQQACMLFRRCEP